MPKTTKSPTEDVSYVIFYNKGKELNAIDIKKYAFSYNPLIKNKKAQATELAADEYALENIERNCRCVSWRADLASIYQNYLSSENENDLGENGYWIIKMKGNRDEVTQLLSTTVNPKQTQVFDRILSIMNNGRTVLLTRDILTQEIIIDNKPNIKKPTEKPRKPYEYRNDKAAAERYKFFQNEKTKQIALNEAQKNIIRNKIQPLLNVIVDNLKPFEIKLILGMTIYSSSFLPQDTEIFKQRNILIPLQQIQEIVFHAYPQNMLSLSKLNDDTAPAVTKEAVISYIKEFVKNTIDIIENQLQDIYKTTDKLYIDAKQDVQIVKQIFTTPALLELFKNDMGTFLQLIEDHLSTAAEFLDTLFPLCPLDFWFEIATSCPALTLRLLDKHEIIEYLKDDHRAAVWIDDTINAHPSVAEKILSTPELIQQIDFNYIIDAGVFYPNWKKYAEENPVLSKILNEDEENTIRYRMI